jgi:predicted HTH transcriptional regulator
MDKNELLQKLSDIEWDDFEVKKAEKEFPKSAWETISAFSNGAGGWLVLGISQNNDKFEITGVSNPEKISQDFTSIVRSKTKFNVDIKAKCRKYKFDDKTVLAFHIPSADKKPVFYNSPQNTFIRTASGDHRASDYEMNALYRDQAFGTITSKPAPSTSIKTFNKDSYDNFRDYLKRMMPDSQYNKYDNLSFNRRLQLVKDGNLTYGGLLFLGRNEHIQKHFVDFRIDYLEIPGISYDEASPRYTFRIQEQENLWEYYFVVFQRLRNYADNSLHINNMGIGRESNGQISALREALVNMIIHCDYFSPMKPRIRVFTNRIEFENPGGLPLPLDELMKADISVPRNPVLAKFFRCAGLCENAGYGFDKMLAWKKETGNDVSINSSINSVKIIFMMDENRAIKGMQADNNLNENISRYDVETTQKLGSPTTQKTSGETTQKSPSKTTQKTAQKIIAAIGSNPYITRKQLSALIGISQDGVKDNLRKLKDAKIIKREGADRGGKWIILNNRN